MFKFSRFNIHDYLLLKSFDPEVVKQAGVNIEELEKSMNKELEKAMKHSGLVQRDQGGEPFVVDINQATKQNRTFRTALWTGKHLQVTVMSIDIGDDIGLEMHPDTDQFLRIEQGRGLVRMGKRKDQLDFEKTVKDDDAIMVPAGTWHNVINIGDVPLKIYSIYAPSEHPFGTVHKTKRDALEDERNQ